jgi:hypothetical protein
MSTTWLGPIHPAMLPTPRSQARPRRRLVLVPIRQRAERHPVLMACGVGDAAICPIIASAAPPRQVKNSTSRLVTVRSSSPMVPSTPQLDSVDDEGESSKPRRGASSHPVGGIGSWLPSRSVKDAEHRRHQGQRSSELPRPDARRCAVGSDPGCVGCSTEGRHTGSARRLDWLAAYMFIGSLVDLQAFINDVVGVAAVPSITLRVILGAVIVWLISDT